MRRAARLALLYTLEALAALLALAIFAAVVVLWRLASGPAPADALRAPFEDALLRAFEGEAAEIGALTVGYDPALSALTLSASDVAVLDAEGEATVELRRIEAAFALDLLLTGRFAPVEVEARGGLFSLVRRADGAVAAGMGRPERVLAQAVEPRAGAPFLETLREGAADTLLTRLRRVDLRDVELRLVDEVDALTLLVADARAEVVLEEDRIEADLSGAMLTSAGRAPVAASLETGRDLSSLFVDLRVRDLTPAAAAPQRGTLSALGAIDAPIDLDLVIDADAQTGLSAALLNLDAGAGVIRRAGEAYALTGARAQLELDARTGVLDVRALDIDADLLRVSAAGRVENFAEFDNAVPGRADYALEFAAGAITLDGVFRETLTWDGAVVQGVARPADLRIGFDTLQIDLPDADGAFAGAVSLEQVDGRWLPDLELEGPIDGSVTADTVLKYWPVDFALGARDWIRDRILAGRVSNARLDLDISAEALAERFIEDPALSLSFDFAGADVSYVSTMTPLRGLSGSAELRGNSLSLSGTGAAIGPLQIDTIFVEIPRLNPKGAIARFGGTGRGGTAELIALLDQEPLGFATDYGIDPASFSGQGTVEFEIGRPMRRFVAAENIDFTVTADFEDVAGPAGPAETRFTDGVVRIEADPDQLVGRGEATLAGARADITWTERFGLGPDALSTTIAVSALVDGRVLDQLGLPLRRFLDGAVAMEAEVEGAGFDFVRAALSLDLEEAAIALPADLWAKPPGRPAEAALSVALDETGGVSLDRFTLEAGDVSVQASARLAEDGRILEADASQVRLDGLMNLALRADRPEGADGALRLRLTGDYLNGGRLIDQVGLTGFGGDGGAPLRFEAAVDRVETRGVTYSDVDLAADSTPQGLALFALSAIGPAGPVEVYFGPDEAAPGRVLTAQGRDAGALLAAFTGYDNARGGVLDLQGRAPELGAETAGVEGRLEVGAFTLEEMPLLARVLAAGSLEGLGGLLSGEGIQFERFETDFVWDDGVLQLRDARAAGPALGVTWSGVADLADARLDMDGTLLPSYGVNSVLGSLPIVGGLLTSREGEGVIGVTFSVEGPFDALRVFANPLSALAPGVFRRIFEGTSAERELEMLEARREAAEAEAGEDGAPDEAAPTPEAGAPSSDETGADEAGQDETGPDETPG